jgi:hypothetical protein
VSDFSYKPQDLFGQGHHLNDEGVALFVDALKLGHVEDLPIEIREHVGGCLDCKMEISDLDAATRDLEYSNVKDNPFKNRPSNPHGRSGRFPYFFRIAAVLAVSVAIGSFVLFELNHKEGPAVLAGVTDLRRDTNSNRNLTERIGTSDRSDRFASNFAPLSRLEYAVGSNMRGGPIRLVSPSAGDTVQLPIMFKWETTEPGEVEFQLVTNTDSLLHQRPVTTNHVLMERAIPPGLYYWKVEKGGELLAVGKFFVPVISLR